MNLDIQTDHVAMRPEWHHMIQEWVALCRQRHPRVHALDLTLRHGSDRSSPDEVDAVVTLEGRSVSARAADAAMSLALGNALASLEHELGTRDAVDEPGRMRHPSAP